MVRLLVPTIRRLQQRRCSALAARHIQRAVRLEVSTSPGLQPESPARDPVSSIQNSPSLSQTPNEDKETQVIWLLITVLLVFALCWLPLRIYQVIKFFFPDILLWPLIPKIYMGCYWLGMSNSAMNPVIYSFYFIRRKEAQARSRRSALERTTSKNSYEVDRGRQVELANKKLSQQTLDMEKRVFSPDTRL